MTPARESRSATADDHPCGNCAPLVRDDPPFEDGNGRLITEQALTQGLETLTLTALAATIHRYRRAFYDQLHRASRDLAIIHRLAWFTKAVLETQEHMIDAMGFLVSKTQLSVRLHGQLNSLQKKVLLCIFGEGPASFIVERSYAHYDYR